MVSGIMVVLLQGGASANQAHFIAFQVCLVRLASGEFGVKKCGSLLSSLSSSSAVFCNVTLYIILLDNAIPAWCFWSVY